jgi:hypothetical protein
MTRDVAAHTVNGMLTSLLYIAALTLLAIHPLARTAALASSPAGVAHGHIAQLLSSGLIVDGPAAPQIVALAFALIYSAVVLGAARTWLVAISAHVGATLLAYAFVAGLWSAQQGLTSAVLTAPDYGISVILAAICGVATWRNRAGAVKPALAGLGALWLIWWWLAGRFSPDVLANLEHLLGFAIGARWASVGDRRGVATAQTRRSGLLERRRAVGVEGVDGLVVPGLALGAVGLIPDHAGLVGGVDEAPARGDLDAVAPGLVAVEEEALGDVVLGGGELDKDVVLDPDVGGPQALLARVDPEGRVMQAPVGALRCVGVLGVDQLVGGDRHRQP